MIRAPSNSRKDCHCLTHLSRINKKQVNHWYHQIKESILLRTSRHFWAVLILEDLKNFSSRNQLNLKCPQAHYLHLLIRLSRQVLISDRIKVQPSKALVNQNQVKVLEQAQGHLDRERNQWCSVREVTHSLDRVALRILTHRKIILNH